ncbi:MAG: NUDIX hydrolase [Saprospiraceae bacterium]|nr:NUDIX hydrolase [Saprospiraceae bacterium]
MQPEASNLSSVESTLKAINDHKVSFSVDCVIFGYGDEGLKILLLECNLPPFIGSWSLLGDFVRHNEDIDTAAYRVLRHYTSLRDIYLEQVATFGETDRHPLARVITTAYYSLMKLSDYNNHVFTGGLRLKWFPIDALPRLAFDHQGIIDACYTRLQKSLRERPIGFELLPRRFTLSQLQTLYEVVLNIELDKRNFRRKLRSLGLLVDTGTTQKDVSHRPAKLFSFDYATYRRRRSGGFQFEL